ncbi:50S ribosomal protein L30 [Pectinatus cerevisiiphilus]|uniref:Large ribosomal subunit protein uL30 n=1 Tax=Pectinatus cerevisiiphilus TaxID=86956 RepID=A0A4R3KAH1_9FIRM|nr:50S ribosomal protein L30 [Pectinatus cerevisiiphilus]TCS79997.1 large subunit ribosomal protein L30 [Pectinatus cerevisiiphilus]
MAKLKVTLTRSLIGHPQDQRATVKALGLKKISSVVEKDDNPAIRGMLHKVEHLIKVEEINA